MKHESMEYDVVIVGAGPAGLAAAIRLKQLTQAQNQELRLCILDKGAQVGAHIMAGAILEPKSLQALLPKTWQEAPLDTQVTSDSFLYCTRKHAFRLPTPKPLRNEGNFLISLEELCQFLAKQAENLGCEIYPGFAATEVLYNQSGDVIGVATGDMGVDKNGQKISNYQPGLHLYAKQTLFAEGCRGELSQRLMTKFDLRQHAQPQTYGLGLKEIWEIPGAQHEPGKVIHTIGWPLDYKTYGGSFIYHFSRNRVAIGFAVGLDYKNPWLSPFEEFQRFKTHPYVRDLLKDGERIAFGARAINEGGWQALPKLSFEGGILLGDCAGFLNVAKIKGIHTAIQSGILGAETTFELLYQSGRPTSENDVYGTRIQESWLGQELYAVRNIRPGFKYGLWTGLALAAWETYITHGKSPWTLPHQADHTTLQLAANAKKIDYPKPDGKLTFDRLSSVYLTNTFHAENQPCHLKLHNPTLAIKVNYHDYNSPETRYCPAAVYEIVPHNQKPKLQINAANCIHCKTCDIKDPRQNILWTAPTGGGGPNYIGM